MKARNFGCVLIFCGAFLWRSAAGIRSADDIVQALVNFGILLTVVGSTYFLSSLTSRRLDSQKKYAQALAEFEEAREELEELNGRHASERERD